MTQYEKEVLKALKTIEKGINNISKELKKAMETVVEIDWSAVAQNFPQTDDEPVEDGEPIDPEDDEVTEDDLPFK